MKITAIQRAALSHMASAPRGEGSAYGLKVATGLRVTVGTMNALSLKGFVRSDGKPGHMAFPQNATFIITDAGRAALA